MTTVSYSQRYLKVGALCLGLLGGLGAFQVNQAIAETKTATAVADKRQAEVLYEQALKLMTDSKNAKANQPKILSLLNQSANLGYAPAQVDLGLLYYLGFGIKQDNTKALAWFNKSAEQGNARAQYYVGLMYTEGKGVEQSEKQAAVWYEKSAEQGYAPAQSYLGVLYLFGIDGIEKDQDKAVELLQKAAKQGDQQAIQLLNKLQPATEVK